MTPLVDIRNASLFIPGQLPRLNVLENISWVIGKKEHCALYGPNGSGKSTLLKFIHGDLWAASGSIFWYNGALAETSPIAGRELSGLVAPHIQAFVQLQAWDVTGLDVLAGARTNSPLSFGDNPDAASEADIVDLMERLDGYALLGLRLPELSQGQMRLLLIARELLRAPELLLLDEWSEGLDANHRMLLMNEFERAAENTTMIFASHRQDGVPDWVRGARFLQDGKLYEKRPSQQIKRTNREIITAPQKSAAPGGSLFELRNVSVYIDRQPVLHNINWKMNADEHWLISGPNGSGKSTFLRLLAGDEFVFAGGSFRHWSPKFGRMANTLAERRASASLVSDMGESLYGYNLTGLELTLSGIDNTVGIYREFDSDETTLAMELIRFFFAEKSAEIARQSIRRLSSGELRKLHLARALANRPDVLLLDEPCSGLDGQSRQSFLELLGRLANGGIAWCRPALVIVSHQAEDVPCWIGRTAKMSNGMISVAL